MNDSTVIEADLTWVNDAFEERVQVVVNSAGIIEQVGWLDLQPTQRLAGEALLPGMVNAHSHAFQRGLRGFGEVFPHGAGSFWSWREAMYELVECLDTEEFTNVCRMAFEEMLRQGITTVGEFHYFHHERGNANYALDDAVLTAAEQAGIRIVLLEVFYAHGGIGRPLEAAQKRFATPDVSAFCRHVDALRDRVTGPAARVGLSAHSIRAATPEEMVALADHARQHGLVLHVHAEEQPQEIEACRAAYRMSPVELMLERGIVAENVTLVHCTHTPADTLRRVVEAGAMVCVCPLTEANLGDGIIDLGSILEAGGQLALGSDSNARISMNEEMRWLEYVQRARWQRRGVCLDGRGRCAHALWRAATAGGARSLGINAGAIASGCMADMICVDAKGLSLLGATRESLLPAFVMGADRAAITRVCVGGHWRVFDD